MAGTGTATIMTMTTAPDPTALLRLQIWLSPAFPVGGFSYSHGLEYAVEAGLVCDRATLQDWIGTLLLHGTGRSDGMLLGAAWRTVREDGAAAVAELAAAFRGTSELARESALQGAAFLAAVRAVWPDAELEDWAGRLAAAGIAPVLPVAVGAVCRCHGVPLATALPLYLQAFAANLVSAAVRLVPLGQTDGLRAIAALEPVIGEAAHRSAAADLDELGTATPMLDWCSMRHETQYTRLFRS